MTPYLELVRHILEHGERKDDRTGTGTMSVFGVQIRYDLGRDSNMRLEIYDARGRRVRSLEQGARGRGTYVVQWNGRDDSGALAARGVYFISLNTERQLFSRKVVLAR